MARPPEHSWLPFALTGCGCAFLGGFLLTAAVALTAVDVDGVGNPVAVRPAPMPPSAQPIPPSAQRPKGFGSQPEVRLAVVTKARPAQMFRVGDRCSVALQRVAASGYPSGYACRAEVRCGSRTLYGGKNAGYFPCEYQELGSRIRGEDRQTRSADGDAAFQIDTATRAIVIEDDASGPLGAFRVEAQLEGLPRGAPI
ncbi:MAG: hypothetical protein AAF355_14200 [Myxococcota bacterium]